MATQHTAEPSCPTCGAAVPPDAPRGYCLKCLFVLGTEERHFDTPDPSPFVARSLGDYELLEEIARGGMGVVYKARQKSLGRIVAVKMLLFGGHAGKQQAQRLRAEAAAAASLQHPNIVSIHEVNAHDGQPFFVMDFIQGENLAELNAKCEVRNSTWIRRGAGYVKIVAEAIHYAHEQGILHRDLKPSNVLLDSFDQPRVTDFGLAKQLHGDSELTLSGQVIGSPNFIPPEQAAARRGLVGRRSDIYSLGAILYHLLTGRPPFVGETLTETLQEVVNNEPIAPRLLNPNVPPDLETLCLKCLEKEPSRRYSTAQGLAGDLARFLRNEPIQARPVSQVEKLWRWCGRRPLVASLAATTLFLLLAVAIGSPIAIFRINRERERAQELSKNETQLREQADRRVYASDMNLAQRALEMNNIGGAISLLNRYRPTNEIQSLNRKSEADFRGWEWRYLWNQCQSGAESVFCKATNQVFSLSVSHDGKWLALGINSTGVSIRDRITHQEITFLPSNGHMVRVAFSPRELLLAYTDVPSLGSSKTNFSVYLWDGISRRIVKTLQLRFYCHGLAFSEDGQTLVTCTQNFDNHPSFPGFITLWRISDGSLMTNYLAPQFGMGEGTPFALATDLSIAAHQTENDKVTVIDLATGRQLWKSDQTTDDYVAALAFSTNKKLLASGAGTADSVIRLWDVGSGQQLRKLEGHRAGINQLLFFPDGRTLASASGDQTIRLWDVTDPANAHVSKILQGHRSRALSLALLPDRTTLASGASDGTVLLWNTAAPERRVKRFTLPRLIGPWRFTPDSRSVVGAFEDGLNGQILSWSVDTDFQKAEQLLDVGTDRVDDACFSRDARWLATSYPDGRVRIWDLQNRRQTGEFNAQMRRVSTHEFTANGKKLFLLDQEADNTLYEWDLTTAKERRTRTWRFTPGRWTGALSPDENWFLSSILNPDSVTITSLTELNTSKRIDLHLPWFRAAAFSQDSKLFALGGWGTDVRLFETATANAITGLRGILTQVWGLAFSPDGKRFITGGGGSETLTVWDADSYEKLAVLEGTGSACDMVAFSPDGNLIAARTERGVLHLWRAPSWEEITAAERAQVGDGITKSK